MAETPKEEEAKSESKQEVKEQEIENKQPQAKKDEGAAFSFFKKREKELEEDTREPKIKALETFMKYFSYVYVAFCWACTVEYFCFGQTSIQMSYFGSIFWYVFIIGLIGACYGGRGHRRGVGWRGTLGSVLCTIMFAIIVYAGDTNHMITALGMFTKRGFFGLVFYWNIRLVSNILFWYFILGGVAIFVYEFIHRAPPRQFEDEEERRRVTYQSRVKWISFFVLFIIVIICSFVPPVRDSIGYVFNLLSTGDINKVIEYIRSFGPWAVAVSTFLMVFQALAAPIPAFLITFSNAAVFGWVGGCILSWSSAMLAAAICFYIARFFGRDAVMLFMSRGALASVDRWFTKYGKNAILICRLLPFVSFDYISYAAGITGMSFLDFFIWTGIGQLPATIVYSYVGSTLTGDIAAIFSGMITLFIVAGVIWFLAGIWKSRHKDLMDESNETADAENAEKRAELEVNAKGKVNMMKEEADKKEADVKNVDATKKEDVVENETSDDAKEEVVEDSDVVKDDTVDVVKEN